MMILMSLFTIISQIIRSKRKLIPSKKRKSIHQNNNDGDQAMNDILELAKSKVTLNRN